MVARRSRRRRRGSVLVVTLIMLLLIASLAMTLGTAAQAQARVATDTRELSESALVADTGLARAKARLVYEFARNWWGQDPDLKGMTAGQSHAGWLTTPEGAVVDLTCARRDPEFMDFLLVSRAGGRAPRELEMVVRLRYVLSSSPRLRGRGAGAIIGFGPVAVTGNFMVDGRDHPADDPYTVLAGSGAPGISSTQRVRLDSGAVRVGGTSFDGVDHDPVGRDGGASDGVEYDANAQIWSPEQGDASSDGVDNDFDGQIDETSGQPTSADEYFDVAPGDLKAMAIASGTFFTDLAAYNRYVKREGNSRNGVDDDGDGVVDDDGSSAAGKVIYLEVPNGSTVGGGEGDYGAVQLPVNPAPDDLPAIVVIAGQDPTRHDVSVGPVHCNNGIFQGVLLSERIVNMNGNGGVMGQVVTFTRNGPSVGSGTFDVWYSTEVLDRLPRRDGSEGGDEPTAVEPVVLMWREAVVR